jgi:Cu/Ag efflux protein CusF
MNIKLILIGLALSGTCALAQTAADPHAGHHASPTAAASAPADTTVWTQGEIRKIDPATGKVTLRHQAIVNLDMPPMTMVFSARPPKLLEGLKVGDAVRFHAENPNGAYLVTHIEKTAP